MTRNPSRPVSGNRADSLAGSAGPPRGRRKSATHNRFGTGAVNLRFDQASGPRGGRVRDRHAPLVVTADGPTRRGAEQSASLTHHELLTCDFVGAVGRYRGLFSGLLDRACASAAHRATSTPSRRST